jgi:hypothetical protein
MFLNGKQEVDIKSEISAAAKEAKSSQWLSALTTAETATFWRLQIEKTELQSVRLLNAIEEEHKLL